MGNFAADQWRIFFSSFELMIDDCWLNKEWANRFLVLLNLSFIRLTFQLEFKFYCLIIEFLECGDLLLNDLFQSFLLCSIYSVCGFIGYLHLNDSAVVNLTALFLVSWLTMNLFLSYLQGKKRFLTFSLVLPASKKKEILLCLSDFTAEDAYVWLQSQVFLSNVLFIVLCLEILIF